MSGLWDKTIKVRTELRKTPPRLIHRIRSRCHMWRIVDDGNHSLYAWVPLSATIQSLMNQAATLSSPRLAPLDDAPLTIYHGEPPAAPSSPRRLPPLYKHSKPMDPPAPRHRPHHRACHQRLCARHLQRVGSLNRTHSSRSLTARQGDALDNELLGLNFISQTKEL